VVAAIVSQPATRVPVPYPMDHNTPSPPSSCLHLVRLHLLLFCPSPPTLRVGQECAALPSLRCCEAEGEVQAPSEG
jgi:hypothetical protein